MRLAVRWICILFLSVFASGCGTPNYFARAYVGERAEPVGEARRVEARPLGAERLGIARVVAYNIHGNYLRMLRSAAREVGATAFKVDSEVIEVTESGGVLPVTTPSITTTYLRGTGSAYGTGGSAYGSFSGTTTTYGSRTTYVPYSVTRVWRRYQAEFFREADGEVSK